MLWTLCVLTLVAVPAAAQSEKGAPWTLPRLIQHALDNNNRLAAARLGTSVAEQDVTIAKGQNWPRVDAVGSLEHFAVRRRLLLPRHGKRPDNPFEESVLNYGLQVTLPLYTGGRIQHEISAAEAVVAASRFRAEMSRQELILNVTSAYYTYLRVHEVIAANEALVRSVGESRRIVADQVEVGRAAPLDVLRLEARLSAAESRLTTARNDIGRIAATLKALLVLPAETPFKIVGDLSPAQTAWDAKTARSATLVSRLDLETLRREIKAQKERVGIAKASQLPTVDASAFYGAATGNDTLNDARFRIGLNIPLYTGGILTARKRKALARLRQLEAKLADAERAALAEVERALIELSSTKARLAAGSRAIAQAEEALRVESQKFREGRGTSNDLLLTEEALLRAKTELAAAMADNRIATAVLNFSMGELDVPAE